MIYLGIWVCWYIYDIFQFFFIFYSLFCKFSNANVNQYQVTPTLLHIHMDNETIMKLLGCTPHSQEIISDSWSIVIFTSWLFRKRLMWRLVKASIISNFSHTNQWNVLVKRWKLSDPSIVVSLFILFGWSILQTFIWKWFNIPGNCLLYVASVLLRIRYIILSYLRNISLFKMFLNVVLT